jgi:hypothetical protein
MGQVLRRGIGVLAVLLCCIGTVQAQKPASREPSTGDFARQFEKDLKDAEEHDPASGEILRYFKSWFILVVLAMVLVSAAVAVKVGVWVFRRMSATTDPEKLAMSDPWVRAQLARQRALEDGPPPIG